MIRYHIIASGRVQGVGFRWFVWQSASNRGVTGWVRNLIDGTVEMELQGKSVDLCAVIEDMNNGNQYIDVENLEIAEIPVVEGETKFKLDYF